MRDMKKIDARCLSPEAQEERRRQALRLREDLQWSWKEIARVVGVHISTVIRWGQRFGRDGEAGLKSRRQGRRYLTGRTLTLPKVAGALDFGGRDAGATGIAVCAVEPAGGHGIDRNAVWGGDADSDGESGDLLGR
ncbi:MAG: helix-turn-helix domain-containing protein [Candidatus Competibacteraceae bacterium]|nr:helix-turn-helix domain-containing protein [Candidatus Competibacteraceae bacterium]